MWCFLFVFEIRYARKTHNTGRLKDPHTYPVYVPDSVLLNWPTDTEGSREKETKYRGSLKTVKYHK